MARNLPSLKLGDVKPLKGQWQILNMKKKNPSSFSSVTSFMASALPSLFSCPVDGRMERGSRFGPLLIRGAAERPPLSIF